MNADEREQILLDCLLAEDPMRALAESPLGHDSEARDELMELIETAGQFDDVGREQRELLAEAARMPSKPGRAEAALREALLANADPIEDPAPPSVARRFPWWAPLLAAAAALLLFLRPWEPGTDLDTPLGDDELRLLEPVRSPDGGWVFDFESPALDGDTPAGDVFAILRVYDEGDIAGPAVAESGRLTESLWSVPETLTLPETVRWRVTLYRGLATPVLLSATETESVMR